ncbi:ABC transporter substrate-binding protein [Thermodesulfobacteriota bacterium]
MKKSLIIVASLVFFLSLGFVSGLPTALGADWDKIVAAAKKEGKVMIYGRGDPEVRKQLTKAFSDKYGIDLEFVYLHRGGEMIGKMKKERGAGLYLADIIIHGPSTMINGVKPAGMLEPLDPLLMLPEVKDPSVYRPGYNFIDKKDHTIKPLRALSSLYLTRNTNLVKDEEITSYQDILDPKWKGKMVMTDPSIFATGMAFVSFLNCTIGPEKAEEYLRKLAKQEPVVTRAAREPYEWLARGKYHLGVALRNEIMPEFLKIKAPVAKVHVKEPYGAEPGAACIGVATKRPHPNAAVLFLNWLLSKEGMTVWSKADGYATARKDVSTDWLQSELIEGLGDNDNVFFFPEEEHARRRAQMKLSKEIFAPLMKRGKKSGS